MYGGSGTWPHARSASSTGSPAGRRERDLEEAVVVGAAEEADDERRGPVSGPRARAPRRRRRLEGLARLAEGAPDLHGPDLARARPRARARRRVARGRPRRGRRSRASRPRRRAGMTRVSLTTTSAPGGSSSGSSRDAPVLGAPPPRGQAQQARELALLRGPLRDELGGQLVVERVDAHAARRRLPRAPRHDATSQRVRAPFERARRQPAARSRRGPRAAKGPAPQHLCHRDGRRRRACRGGSARAPSGRRAWARSRRRRSRRGRAGAR